MRILIVSNHIVRPVDMTGLAIFFVIKGGYMKNNNIIKMFIKYVSLNVCSMFGLSLYVLADTFFVANGIGNKGLVALNLALPVYSLINGLGLMLGIGGATKYSIAKGSHDDQSKNTIFTTTIIVGACIGAVFLICGLLFTDQIAGLLGAKDEVLILSSQYLRVIMIFGTAFIINNIFVCFVRNDESPKLAMMGMLIGCLSNIVLDYVFVFPFQWGMTGAALATGGAPIVSMCILSLHKIKKRNKFHFTKIRMQIASITNIMSLGLGAFVTELSSGIIMMVFNFIILGISGNTGVGAYGIISNVALVCVALFTGIGQGIQPIVSLYHGLGHKKNVRLSAIMAGGTALAFGVIFLGIGLLFAHEITAVFNKDANVLLEKIAVEGIYIYFVGFLLMGINIAGGAFLACIEKPKAAVTVSILRGGLILIPVAFILSNILGIKGVWMAIPISETITCICTLIFLKKPLSS